MILTRLQKAKRNIIWLLIYEITVFGCNLILPRLIISTYGSAYNGMIASITQFLSFVVILRLGVAGAMRVALYKTLAAADQIGTSAIVNATAKHMRKIGFVIIGYTAILAIVYPVYIKSDYGFLHIAVLVIAIGIGVFAQYFFGITCQTLLAADQKLYIYNIIQTITALLNTGISAFLIIRGFSIQFVKLLSASLYFISPVVLNKIVLRMYCIDRSVAPDTEALSKKNDVMAHSIANIVHENTDVIVLTVFSNVMTVSIYSVYHLVISGLKQMLSLFTTGAEAVFGDMWARGESENIRQKLSCYELIIGAFISIVFSAAILLILPFISLYTAGVTDVQYVLPMYALIIICAQAFYSFRMPYQALVQAAGHYRETKMGAYCEAGLNFLASVILVQFIGIVGTAIGTMLANIFRSAQYAIHVNKYLVKRKTSDIPKRLLWITFNLLLSMGTSALIIKDKPYIGWEEWVLCGVIIVLISTICCTITALGFYKDDLRQLQIILSRMVHKG